MDKVHISPTEVVTIEKSPDAVLVPEQAPKKNKVLWTCVTTCFFLVILTVCAGSLGFLVVNGSAKNLVCKNSLSDSYLYQKLNCSTPGLSSLNLNPTFSQGKTIESIDPSKYTTQEELITKIVDQATPSVVTVVAVSPSDPAAFSNGVDGQSQNIGSGFVVREDGLIITNSHVVSDETVQYSVIIGTEKNSIPVKQIFRDSANDVAILKVDKTGLPAIKLGDSDTVKRGNTAIAIGSPLGDLTGTVTSGIISGLNRDVTAGSGDMFSQSSKKYQGVIQIDAPINPGNSGGPLLNSKAEVIGVNFATTSGADSISFALPINRIKAKLTEFQINGKLLEPYIGIGFSQRTFYLKDSVLTGALVSQVQVNSPASVAGIQNGDLILSVDGKSLENASLLDIIQTSKVGSDLKLEIWRKAEKINISVKVGDKSSVVK
ncbi:MAG: trypsin-like peptidase domain-containing protein [bacterium]